MRVSLSNSGQRGTTMIELVIVVAIIGILALLTVPNLEAWLARMRLNAATTKIVSTIKNTRQLAISESVRYCLNFTGDTSFGNGNDGVFEITASLSSETAMRSTVWTASTTAAPIVPTELDSWSNKHDCTSGTVPVGCREDLFRGVSLETGSNTSIPTVGSTGCVGWVFNKQGFLDNAATDFDQACGAGSAPTCARLTLISKGTTPIEQRSIWIDRGGNARVTSGPSDPPTPL